MLFVLEEPYYVVVDPLLVAAFILYLYSTCILVMCEGVVPIFALRSLYLGRR